MINNLAVKPILLAAGVGERLRPFTNLLPKCLMPINGVPLLEYWL
ncbi:MAG: sugar phosphate nucleotidyltransferase, partial [Candidatus Poribacteria bacterium]|nr:sugar phosphate nucleotidyltransferase [Candidatus Poribacteria bacterium]